MRAANAFSASRSVTATLGTLSGTFTVITIVADSQPDSLDFGAIVDVAPGSTQTSREVTMGGINVPAALEVSGGLWSVNGGPFTREPGTVVAGDRVRLRGIAASAFSTPFVVHVTIGGVAARFTIVTRARNDGDVLDFDAIADVPRDSLQLSAEITVSNLDGPAAITSSGGQYRINGGAFTDEPGQMQPGDRLQLRGRAPAAFGETATVAVSVGALRGSFRITAEEEDAAIDMIDLGSISGIEPGSTQLSSAVTISGINTAVPISIEGGEYRINDGGYTTAAGVGRRGDSLQVRTVANGTYGSTVQATLRIGGASATFSVSTLTELPATTGRGGRGGGAMSPLLMLLLGGLAALRRRAASARLARCGM